MSKMKDRTGNRIGKLTVLSFDSIRDKRTYWNCVCDCGNHKIVLGASLQTAMDGKGGTRSCGCIERFNKLPHGVAARNHLMRGYRAGALKRGHSFSLTLEQFETICQSDCHYCGSAPSKGWNRSEYGYNGSYLYNGIDRYDNNVGYEIQNCVPCCKDCNMAKRQLSASEFIQLCKNVVSHQAILLS